MDELIVARKMAIFRIQAVVAELNKRERNNYKGCTPTEKSIFKAIKNILVARIKNKEFNKDDLEQIRAAQNIPIPRYHDPREETAQGTQILNPVMDIHRIYVDYLMKYLDCFTLTPELEKDNPVGYCKCESVFMKKRSDQRFCSAKCREKSWRTDKKEEDPGFFAKKARDLRKHPTFEDMKILAQSIWHDLEKSSNKLKKGEKEKKIRERLVKAGFRRANRMNDAQIRKLCGYLDD